MRPLGRDPVGDGPVLPFGRVAFTDGSRGCVVGAPGRDGGDAAAWTPVSPADQRQLRKRIEALDKPIDTGAERVFAAPEAIVAKLYAKLDQLREERGELQRQLDAAAKPETCSAEERDRGGRGGTRRTAAAPGDVRRGRTGGTQGARSTAGRPSAAPQTAPGIATTFSLGISTVPFSKSSAVGFSVRL